MMAATIQAMEREDLRRSVTKSLRSKGSIPAIVYGKKREPKPVAIDSIEMLKTIREHGRNSVYSLQVEGGESINVILYDYQEDPLKNEIIHADFYEVDMSQEVEVEVPIKLVGQEKIKDGVIQQTLHEMTVKAKPNEIPEFLQIDISDLKIGDSLSVRDLIHNSDHKFEMLGDETTDIVTVLPPQSAGDPLAGQASAEAEEKQEEEAKKEENEKEK